MVSFRKPTLWPDYADEGRSAGFKTGFLLTQGMGVGDECGRHKAVWKPALRLGERAISGLADGHPDFALDDALGDGVAGKA
jgi:hypothetical protein